MTDILKTQEEYETPTVAVTPLIRADVITTSAEVDQPTVPDYSGDEWDPF